MGRRAKRVAWGSALESLCEWRWILRWAPRGFAVAAAFGSFVESSDRGDFFEA